jgi:subtilisin family serine protease
MNRIAGFLIGILLSSQLLFAGNGGPSSTPNLKTWDKTLMLRVKPEYRDWLGKASFTHPKAAQMFSALGLKKFFSRFPHRQIPRNVFHFTGERIPDMTLIYQFHYEKELPVQEAIRIAMSTGLFEYAEPKYIRNTQFVPNDPLQNQQYHLDSIQVFQAWDITRGDTNVVVGICDSGVQTDHPDLEPQIKIDPTEPINGLDDNNDGKVDNNRGWDFCGPAFDPNFEGDNDANITQGNASHGTHVAGISAARTNNGLGVAGVGFNCKIMPLKCAPDNGGGSIYYGYEAIEYGASHGAHIINCSWGGPGGYSTFEQEVITDATLTFNTLVVAAAGNDNSPDLFYPAYYNHVLAVSALGTGNRRAGFTNYNYKVNVGAPGVNINSTYFQNSYQLNSGTSMASPVVAGVAALVRSQFPELSADQVAKRIRVTSDNIYTIQGNNLPAFYGKFGRGIVNAYRAVTEDAPGLKNLAVRVSDNDGDNLFQPGDSLLITADFINYLQASGPDMKVTFSVVTSNSTSTYVVGDPATAETILGVMTTNEIKNNNGKPFKIFLKPNLPNDRNLDIRMYYSEGTYYDYDHHTILLNPTFINVEKNNISTTFTSKGRIGFNDDNSSEGLGFKHKGRQTLYELGLITGTSATKIANTCRGSVSGGTMTHDNDYRNVSFIKEVSIPMTGTFQYNNTMTDANAGSAASNITITQQSYAKTTPGDSNYVIVRYLIKNNSTTAVLNNFFVGLYGDFDISASGQQDKAGWSAIHKMGFTYNSNPDGLYSGIAVLGDATPNYYAIDNDATAADTFGVYDGYTDAEKYKSISSGIYRRNAGVSGPKDVSIAVGAGPYSIAPGDTIDVGFAIVAGENLDEILQAADTASEEWPDITRIRNHTSTITRQFALYPNPASQELFIKGEVPGNLQIFDARGREYSIRLNQAGISLYRLSLTELPPGIYLLKSQDGRSARFVKE